MFWAFTILEIVQTSISRYLLLLCFSISTLIIHGECNKGRVYFLVRNTYSFIHSFLFSFQASQSQFLSQTLVSLLLVILWTKLIDILKPNWLPKKQKWSTCECVCNFDIMDECENTLLGFAHFLVFSGFVFIILFYMLFEVLYSFYAVTYLWLNILLIWMLHCLHLTSS
jgi:hypothetical protein